MFMNWAVGGRKEGRGETMKKEARRRRLRRSQMCHSGGKEGLVVLREVWLQKTRLGLRCVSRPCCFSSE